VGSYPVWNVPKRYLSVQQLLPTPPMPRTTIFIVFAANTVSGETKCMYGNLRMDDDT
jgi:hypothetical protein